MRTLVLAAVAALSMAGTASASGNRYAMVAVSNPTSSYVTYNFRWGDGEWTTYYVAPGEVRWHSWTYDYENQNRSPVPAISFDCDLGSGYMRQHYELIAFASPWQDASYANRYTFSSYAHGRWLDLYSAA